MPLVSRAGSITGADANPAVIELFVRICRQRSMTGLPVAGRWPDIAGQVKPHDIAASHHVAYNVSVIEDYLLALTAWARRRGVLEVTPGHPQAQLNHLWLHFYGIQRPETPTVDELVAALHQLELAPQVESTRRPAPPTPQPATCWCLSPAGGCAWTPPQTPRSIDCCPPPSPCRHQRRYASGGTATRQPLANHPGRKAGTPRNRHLAISTTAVAALRQLSNR